MENRMRVKYLTSLTVGKEFTPVCQLITIGKTQVCSVKSSEWSIRTTLDVLTPAKFKLLRMTTYCIIQNKWLKNYKLVSLSGPLRKVIN